MARPTMPVDHSPIMVVNICSHVSKLYILIICEAFSCAEDMYGTHCTGIVCPNSIYFLACETIWRCLNECISIRKQMRIVSQSQILTKMAGKKVKN